MRALTICFCLCFAHLSLQAPQDYPDVLNLKGVPSSPNDEAVYGLSDLGAWHLWSLPNDLNYAGGFTGPNVLNGIGFIGQSFLRLESINDPFVQGTFQSYPGYLTQTLTSSQGLTFTLQLIFASNRSNLIQLTVRNPTNQILQSGLSWNGTASFTTSTLSILDVTSSLGSGIMAPLRTGMLLEIRLPVDLKATPSVKDQSYRLDLPSITLNPSQSWQSTITFSCLFNTQEQITEELLLSMFLKSPDTYFQQNSDRWNGYLSNALSSSNTNSWITVKAVEILMTNWRSAVGGTPFKHDGLYPSYFSYQGYWAWDSWKHAASLATVNPSLAKDQIRSMFDPTPPNGTAFQGMVCDVFYISGVPNWRNTKPPLSSWAVFHVVNRSSTQPDLDFINEMYSKLVTYHQWWYLYRDVDNNGLCEYGSTDGTTQAAKWESGMDNAVRFDNSTMVQNTRANNAYSFNQESVDLNSYLYMEKIYLANMATLIGKSDDATNFQQQAAQLKTQIQQTLFDSNTGYFYDRQLSNGPFISVEGPEGWFPLWAGIATSQQASAVRSIILNPSKFNLYVPFPTVTADAPQFDPATGYWRGPMWYDQAYFGVQALKNAGYASDATNMATELLTAPQGTQTNDQTPLHEYYNPTNGEALGAPFFGWSSAHTLMLANGL